MYSSIKIGPGRVFESQIKKGFELRTGPDYVAEPLQLYLEQWDRLRLLLLGWDLHPYGYEVTRVRFLKYCISGQGEIVMRFLLLFLFHKILHWHPYEKKGKGGGVVV